VIPGVGYLEGGSHRVCYSPAQFLEQYEIKVTDLPTTFVWDPKEGFYYYNATMVATDAGIRAFLDAVHNGQVPAQGEGKGVFADLKKMGRAIAGKSWETINAYPVYFVIGLVTLIGSCAYCCIFMPVDDYEGEGEGGAAKEGAAAGGAAAPAQNGSKASGKKGGAAIEGKKQQ